MRGIFFGLLLVLLSGQGAFADGMFISSEEIHLHSPQQKAAIAWDGTTEQMVLVSRVQSDQVSDMAWVVPIQSKVQPRVEKSDIAVFEDLTALFGADDHRNYFADGGSNAMSRGVEVVEEKKVDIYDIAVLKGGSAGEIQQWLDANGYKAPPEAKTILDGYAQRSGMYFVANRIDLKNKYQVEELKAQDLYQGIKRLLEDKKKAAVDEHAALMNKLQSEMAAVCPSWKTFIPEDNWDPDYFRCQIEKVRERFVQMGKSAREYVPAHKDVQSVADMAIDDDVWVSFWVVDDYDGKRASAVISYKQQQLLNVDLWRKLQVGTINRTMFSYIPADVLDRVEDYAAKISLVFLGEWQKRSQICGQSERSDEMSGEIDDAAARLEKMTPAQLYCGAEQFRTSFPQIVPNVILAEASWPDPSVVQGEYCQAISTLGEGMATPLKITFEPEAPYYPLAISSSGVGGGSVDVYVISQKAVYDQNMVLGSDKDLPLTPAMKDTMVQHFGNGPWQQGTRLSWSGQLKALKTDAVFKER